MNQALKDAQAAVPRKVLLIDDNTAIHDDFASVLMDEGIGTDAVDAAAALMGLGPQNAPANHEGWQVGRPVFDLSTATQGQEGFAMVQAAMEAGQPYEMVFVDMRMPPGWDGVQTIKALWSLDPDLEIVICSAYSDYAWEDIQNKLSPKDNLLILKKPFDSAELKQMAFALTEKTRIKRSERKVRLKLQDSIARLENEIVQREKAEAETRHVATHDPLTGLPNRLLVNEQIEQCIVRAKRDHNHQFAVIFIDLDHFKFINDSLGHRSGDSLLVEASRRLVDTLRLLLPSDRPRMDSVARISGDEFVVLLDGLGDSEQPNRVADLLQSEMAKPFSINDHDVNMTLSMGVALADFTCDAAETVLRDADTALQHAKRQGPANTAMFNAGMRQALDARVTLETELRRAERNDQLRLMYQPLIDLSDGSIHGFEALLRWKHPVMGEIPVQEFVAVAEETGQIVDIGLWVLNEAARQLAQWRRQHAGVGLEHVGISVNVSPNQFVVRDVVDQFAEVVGLHGLKPTDIHLEITETAMMADAATLIEKLHMLRDLGFSIHLDDFGTGYSSLAKLQDLPVDVLKIDQAFVRGMDNRSDKANTVQAIVHLAHLRGLKVVAEGVETIEQLVQLQTLDADIGQGYFFSRPVEADRVAEFLSQNRTWLRLAA